MHQKISTNELTRRVFEAARSAAEKLVCSPSKDVELGQDTLLACVYSDHRRARYSFNRRKIYGRREFFLAIRSFKKFFFEKSYKISKLTLKTWELWTKSKKNWIKVLKIYVENCHFCWFFQTFWWFWSTNWEFFEFCHFLITLFYGFVRQNVKFLDNFSLFWPLFDSLFEKFGRQIGKFLENFFSILAYFHIFQR